MLLDPCFRAEDFKRLRDDAINFLKVSLRESNDEELGKEELYNIIYTGDPYGHHNTGKISSLEKLTLADVRGFYCDYYKGTSLTIGLVSGYQKKYPDKVQTEFERVPPRDYEKKRYGNIRMTE